MDLRVSKLETAANANLQAYHDEVARNHELAERIDELVHEVADLRLQAQTQPEVRPGLIFIFHRHKCRREKSC